MLASVSYLHMRAYIIYMHTKKVTSVHLITAVLEPRLSSETRLLLRTVSSLRHIIILLGSLNLLKTCSDS